MKIKELKVISQLFPEYPAEIVSFAIDPSADEVLKLCFEAVQKDRQLQAIAWVQLAGGEERMIVGVTRVHDQLFSVARNVFGEGWCLVLAQAVIVRKHRDGGLPFEVSRVLVNGRDSSANDRFLRSFESLIPGKEFLSEKIRETG